MFGPCRCRLLERGHAPYIETVPFRVILWFTALQLAGLGAVYGITWAGVRPSGGCPDSIKLPV